MFWGGLGNWLLVIGIYLGFGIWVLGFLLRLKEVTWDLDIR